MWKEILKLWKSDNLLQQAWEQSFEMLELDLDMLLESIRVLRESDDNKLDSDIRSKDKTVNKYEREVRKKVLTHISVHGPVSIPAGLVLITIIIDIERIGDYTKNILDLAEGQQKRLNAASFEETLQKIETAVIDIFKRTRVCVEKSDHDEALRILETYEWINGVCDESTRKLIREEDKKLSPGTAAALALYFRYLKRINSHLRNMISSVVNPFHRIGYKYKESKDPKF